MDRARHEKRKFRNLTIFICRFKNLVVFLRKQTALAEARSWAVWEWMLKRHNEKRLLDALFLAW